jgi:hypothetical protein
MMPKIIESKTTTYIMANGAVALSKIFLERKLSDMVVFLKC